MVDEPGLLGWVTVPPSPPSGRLFVSGAPRGQRLTAVLDRCTPLEVSLLEDADPTVVRLLDRRPELAGPEEATAMLREPLTGLPRAPLPDGLEVRRVGDGAGCIPLARAAAAARAADPATAADMDEDDLVAHLRRIPDAALLAAVDGEGRVRATAGTSGMGEDATVFLVATSPVWRGRGVAVALTASALRVAAARGASRACLDASAAGRGVYARLGFTAVGTIRSWRRRQPPSAPVR